MHMPTAAVVKFPRVGSQRCACLAELSGDYQPQYQALPKVRQYLPEYEEAAKKAEIAADTLNEAEIKLLTNGLPRLYRHKAAPAAYIESAFDSGMLTVHELARTNKQDLNNAVKVIGESGQLQKALRLVDHLIKFQKANQHTLARFLNACHTVNQPTVALQTWERWLPVRSSTRVRVSTCRQHHRAAWRPFMLTNGAFD